MKNAKKKTDVSLYQYKKVASALRLAHAYLECIGYGNSPERDLARSSGLIIKIDKALSTANKVIKSRHTKKKRL